MEEVIKRLRTSITTVNTDRDRFRIALLSAARENDFLLEATFNRRIARQCVPLQPYELHTLYPLINDFSTEQKSDLSLDVDWSDILRDFFTNKTNRLWASRRGMRLMAYMMHTTNWEEFFTETMGTLQRSDLRRLGSLISEYEEPDAIYLNALTQDIADDILSSYRPEFKIMS